ncbi:MAG: hypothetical protein KF712_20015 [Akkermansiaceae bacterium]|nr:hypothetical protein [Akkermansiaceae bacterium]
MDNAPKSGWHTFREILRFALLLLTLVFGIFIAVHSQASSPNYKFLAIAVSNHLVFYLLFVAFQLWIFRIRGWKVLLVATLVVSAFAAELFIRVQLAWHPAGGQSYSAPPWSIHFDQSGKPMVSL